MCQLTNHPQGPLHRAFKTEPISASKESSIHQREAALVCCSQSKTPTGYHKATKTIFKPVEWAGFNAQQDRLVAGSGNNPKRLTGGVRTDDRLAACPP